MIHRFFATAGNEALDDDHSDGVHFFRDADWRTFREVMINPSKWLKEHVPSRADRIQSKLDLMVVPIPHGFTVDYSEDARLVTLGMGPYRHRASTLSRVAEHLYASQRDVDISGVLHEIRDPELDIVSIHMQLGRWSVWPLIAPVVLQDCNALVQVLVDQAREGRGMAHRIVNPAGHEIEAPEAVPFDLDSRNTFYIQLPPMCSFGESELACLQLYPGWHRSGSGSTKKYCSSRIAKPFEFDPCND